MNDETTTKDFKRTVLVVDDEDVNRSLLSEIIKQKYNVLQAENGRDALSQIRESAGRLSLVLLDLLMTEMDGYEVLQAMRSDAEMKKIPVIVLTSEKSAEIKSLELGAADFLSKPYDAPEVILARVQHSIDLFEKNTIIQATESDHLTRLYTPEFFFEYVSIFDSRQTEEMDAVVIDFCRFNLLNEMHGREKGNEVLYKTADAIRAYLEKRGGLACRHSSDTFYLYSPHTDDYKPLIDSLKSALAGVISAEEVRLRAGIFFDRARELPLVSRFDRALQACNSLRGNYGAEIAVYDEAMHEKEMFNARLLKDFETAIKEKQFVVHYQPKYNITGSEPLLSSAEALIRWQHPEYGLLPPDRFVPLFEGNGLIQRLDRYVWEEAARQIRDWRDKYGETIPVSVNVSRIDISSADIAATLCKIVRDNSIFERDLLLEITESAYKEDSDDLVEKVRTLRSLGFKIEMDDFGSGYSSLNMLTSLPIDALKLDKLFIDNIERGSKEMRIVEIVLDIAGFLGVPVIAEGVETEAQLNLLKFARCDIIQGYYFSKPLSASEFSALIEKKLAARSDAHLEGL